VVKSTKAGLVLFDGTSKGSGNAMEAKAKSKEGDAATKVPKDPMKVSFQADLAKAKKAAKDAKGAMTAAASKMFAFYLNLLSPESKYA
jgi:hypothetical protein